MSNEKSQKTKKILNVSLKNAQKYFNNSKEKYKMLKLKKNSIEVIHSEKLPKNSTTFFKQFNGNSCSNKTKFTNKSLFKI